MDELWIQALIALVAAGLGAGATVLAFRSRSRRPEPPVAPPAFTAPPPDRWLNQMHRCEQAVRRAERAVDSVSSGQARERLRSVPRRMDAELPNVRALVELGRGLEADTSGVSARLHEQLDGAVVRFAAITEQLLEAVVELVSAPDLDRVQRQVAVLRDQFPLTHPMSVVLGTSTPSDLTGQPA